MGNDPTNVTDPTGLRGELRRIPIAGRPGYEIIQYYNPDQIVEKCGDAGNAVAMVTLGVYDSRLGVITRRVYEKSITHEYTVPYATVENAATSGWYSPTTGKEWDDWFAKKHEDINSSSGKNYSIHGRGQTDDGGSWASNYNDFGVGVQQIGSLIRTYAVFVLTTPFLAMAAGRPFIERVADIERNPGNWESVASHVEKATRRGARQGGVSTQTLYRNRITGETLWQHTVTNDRGRIVDSHWRPYFQPRANTDIGP
jgi:hypothetical protein